MDIIQKAEAMAKKQYEKHDPVHKWRHPMAVMKRALEIAKHFEDVDYEALKLAVILHDIVYDSYETHVDKSINFAKKWLKEQGYPEARIRKVAEIMMNHSGPHRRTCGDAKLLEGKIIYDAEKSLMMNTPENSEKYYPRLYLDVTRKLVRKPVK
jgi:HD superfamily phosphodiesterase